MWAMKVDSSRDDVRVAKSFVVDIVEVSKIFTNLFLAKCDKK